MTSARDVAKMAASKKKHKRSPGSSNRDPATGDPLSAVEDWEGANQLFTRKGEGPEGKRYYEGGMQWVLNQLTPEQREEIYERYQAEQYHQNEWDKDSVAGTGTAPGFEVKGIDDPRIASIFEYLVPEATGNTAPFANSPGGRGRPYNGESLSAMEKLIQAAGQPRMKRM